MQEITKVIAASADAAIEAAGVLELQFDEHTAEALAFGGKTGV
ncbi:hypothetical protein [Amycolatopsis sp. cg9]